MSVHKIRKGLDLPMTGQPEQMIEDARQVGRVAIVAADYIGMKPTMHVKVGDGVDRGQLLFEDKKTPGVRYTSIGAGKVVAVNRGERRALQSVVVELAPEDAAGRGGHVRFPTFLNKDPDAMTRRQIRDFLVESGEWVNLRERPFSRVPEIDSEPQAIFVTAMDSNPHAPDPAKVLEGRDEDFRRGLSALGKLTSGTTYVCAAEGTNLTLPSSGDFRMEHFSGPHPAGTAGVHIHTLHPAGRTSKVWWIGYQAVAAIGKLFSTGQLDLHRVVSLAGPTVDRPRLLKTRVGAELSGLVDGELRAGENRIVSGSVLSGRAAQGDIHGYLGRHHQQVSVLSEGREREFLGWLGPGFNKYSIVGTYLSKLLPGKRFAMTTNKNGSDRAIVPIGMYEKVFPLDMPAPFLMRALAVGDIEYAEKLGALELDEEDLGLCSFVCPGKLDYGLLLRDLLTTIEKDG